MDIFESLARYAKRRGVSKVSGWSLPAPYKWEVNFDSQIGVMSLRTAPEGAKVEMPTTARTKAGVSRVAEFCHDSIETVFGLDPNKPRRNADFMRQLEEVRKVAPEPEKIDALINALTIMKSRFKPQSTAKPTWILPDGTEVCAGEQTILTLDSVPLFQIPQIKTLWDTLAAAEWAERANGGIPGFCVVNHTYGMLARIHPIKVPLKGTSPGGAPLVSMDSPELRSYGDPNAVGASISLEGSYTVSRGVLDLLKRPGHRMNLGDSVVLFWAEEAEDPILCLDTLGQTAPPEEIRRLLWSPWRGQAEKPELAGELLVNNLILKGVAGRIAIRYWQTQTLEEIRSRLGDWYSDMEIVGLNKYPSIHHLLRLIYQEDPSRTKPPHIPDRDYIEFYQYATGSKIENGTLVSIAPAMLYVKLALTQIDHRLAYRQKREPIRELLGFLRLAHNRIWKEEPMPIGLDENRDSVPYQIGRLLSFLDRLQQASQDGRMSGSSVGITSYAQIQNSPARVVSYLMGRARIHMDSMMKHHRKGAAWFYKREIEKILARMEAPLPVRFTVQDRVEFCLGFAHQEYQHMIDLQRPSTSEGTEMNCNAQSDREVDQDEAFSPQRDGSELQENNSEEEV